MLVEGDVVTGLLDFEFCAYDWRAMELAVALSKWVALFLYLPTYTLHIYLACLCKFTLHLFILIYIYFYTYNIYLYIPCTPPAFTCINSLYCQPWPGSSLF